MDLSRIFEYRYWFEFAICFGLYLHIVTNT